MSIRRSPVTPIEIDLKPAVRQAVDDIVNFLSIWYPVEIIDKTEAALAITGEWLKRIDGFHDHDDFSKLVRDFLLYVQSGGERSQVSDQITYFFSGFMPTYGAACIFIGMVADRRPWSEVQAFMHTLSYGGAKRYVQTFDWAGGKQKAQAEVDAWLNILKEQVRTLDAAVADAPVQLAFAPPESPPTVTDVPVRVVPPVSAPAAGGAAAEAAATEGIAARLGMLLLRVGGILLLPLLLSGDTPQRDQSKTLTIPEDKPDASAQTNTTNNECQAQIEDNQKNGADCEMDGYMLMEQTLQYKRLVNPPKGKGLDGLFEKLAPNNQPDPMPQMVAKPKPGKLIFLPPESKPPKPAYDFTASAEKRAAIGTYPKFVVFEAKHISKQFGENDADGITKEAKNRLGNTCDGKQMGNKWTDRRIPQALERQDPKNSAARKAKQSEIGRAGYARWIFICLPGPAGDTQVTRLYVLIDVIASGMDLESTPAKIRKQPSGGDL
jgi:hypothetical protein